MKTSYYKEKEENITPLSSQASQLNLQLLTAENYKVPVAPSFALYRDRKPVSTKIHKIQKIVTNFVS